MSLANPLPRATRTSPRYAADGVRRAFPVPFWFVDPADIIIDVITPAALPEDEETVARYTMNDGYVTTGAGDPAGGEVTLAVPPANGKVVQVTGLRVPSRVASVFNGGLIEGPALEEELDLVTATQQELRRDVDRVQAGVIALGGNVVGAPPSPAVIGPYGELLISRFRTAAGAFTDQTAAVQAAFDALATDSNYSTLSLEGRKITITDQIIYRDNAGLVVKPKGIVHGNIYVGGDAVTWNNRPAIRAIRQDGGRIDYLYFRDLYLDCAGRSSGVHIDALYFGVDFSGVTILQPTLYGIQDTDGGADLRICNARIARWDNITPLEQRQTTGIIVHSNDCKITHTVTANLKTGLDLRRGSALVTTSHFFGGLAQNVMPHPPATAYPPCVRLQMGYDNHFAACYFDNGPVDIHMNDGAGNYASFAKRLHFQNCIFTFGRAGTPDYRFVQTRDGNPAGPDFVLKAIFDACTFRYFGPTLDAPLRTFGHRGTGAVDKDNSRVFTRDCNWWGLQSEESDPVFIVQILPGQQQYVLDRSQRTPFNIVFGSATIGGAMTSLTGSYPDISMFVQRLAGAGQTLILNATAVPGTGFVRVTGHCGAGDLN